MTDAHHLIWQAKLLEIDVRVEGMKAENQYREMQGSAQAYGEKHFSDIQSEIEGIISEMQQYG